MELGAMITIERDLRRQCEGLDPDAVAAPEVERLFAVVENVKRLAAGAELLLARKVTDTAGGARSTAEYLASKTGTSVGAAQDLLVTSQRLADQPHTEAAVARGELSRDQASIVADAVAADPTAEQGLLDAAQQSSVKDLRAQAATIKANADPDPKATRERIHRNRSCRTWKDRDGAWHLHVNHLPEVGAEIEAMLAPYLHARFEAGRQSGARESRDAYQADALLDLARAATTGGASPKGGPAGRHQDLPPHRRPDPPVGRAPPRVDL